MTKISISCLLAFSIFTLAPLPAETEAPANSPSQLNQGKSPTAQTILGNPDYPAFSYGGYRDKTREVEPSVEQLKEDMRILSAMGIKLVRTYNTQQYGHAAKLAEAIEQLRNEQPRFEMFIMLGAWIECAGAWTDQVDHNAENVTNNQAEIEAAVRLTKAYPEIIKIIAVGNEAMVHWAGSYFVAPGVILKWVDYLQNLKSAGELPQDVWITSSDNFASWGGGDASYHQSDLEKLIRSVDFISLHTYPFHDTHYAPAYWTAPSAEKDASPRAKAEAAIQRAANYAKAQYEDVADYLGSLGIEKPIHIGETGWAAQASSSYGATGSQAADEYKQGLYLQAMRQWSEEAGITCFYFEAFDEQWKDSGDVGGSENHFGLINQDGLAKYALWQEVDAGKFEGLTRDGKSIGKTFNGNTDELFASILEVPSADQLRGRMLATVNQSRSIGEPVTQDRYLIIGQPKSSNFSESNSHPSKPVKLNVWEGTCSLELSSEDSLRITPGTGDWWGCALEIQAEGKGENLSEFASGYFHFEIKGNTTTQIEVGFQTGLYAAGTQVNNQIVFGHDKTYQLSNQWKSYAIPLAQLNQGGDLNEVTSLLFIRGQSGEGTATIDLRNVYFSREGTLENASDF